MTQRISTRQVTAWERSLEKMEEKLLALEVPDRTESEELLIIQDVKEAVSDLADVVHELYLHYTFDDDDAGTAMC